MTESRTQILLTPEQYIDLAEIAEREKCSIGDLIRDIIQDGIDQREQKNAVDFESRIQALEAARQVRNIELSDLDGKPLIHNISTRIETLQKARESPTIDRDI